MQEPQHRPTRDGGKRAALARLPSGGGCEPRPLLPAFSSPDSHFTSQRSNAGAPDALCSPRASAEPQRRAQPYGRGGSGSSQSPHGLRVPYERPKPPAQQRRHEQGEFPGSGLSPGAVSSANATAAAAPHRSAAPPHPGLGPGLACPTAGAPGRPARLPLWWPADAAGKAERNGTERNSSPHSRPPEPPARPRRSTPPGPHPPHRQPLRSRFRLQRRRHVTPRAPDRTARKCSRGAAPVGPRAALRGAGRDTGGHGAGTACRGRRRRVSERRRAAGTDRGHRDEGGGSLRAGLTRGPPAGRGAERVHRARGAGRDPGPAGAAPPGRAALRAAAPPPAGRLRADG